MPSTALPGANRSTLAMAQAVAAAWRVTQLVTLEHIQPDRNRGYESVPICDS
jgi:hypothetical protein